MVDNFVKKYKKHFLKKSSPNTSTSFEKRSSPSNFEGNKFRKDNGQKDSSGG